MKQEKLTLLEMSIGLWISVILIALLGIIFVGDKWEFAWSVLFGGAVAFFVLFQLYRSLDQALDMNTDQAEKYGVRQAIKRLFIMGLALCISIFVPQFFNIIGVLLGMLGLKFSAYLQPVIHRIIEIKKLT